MDELTLLKLAADLEDAAQHARTLAARPLPSSRPDSDLPRLLLTLTEAGDQLRVSDRTITRLVSEGEVSSVKLGRRRLVPYADLEEYVERLRRSK